MQQAIQAEQQRLDEAREVSATYARTVIELLKKSITAIEAIDQKPVTDYTGAVDGAAADPLAGVELPKPARRCRGAPPICRTCPDLGRAHIPGQTGPDAVGDPGVRRPT